MNYIVLDETIALGNPTIRGTRISVEFVLDSLAQGMTVEEIASEYGIDRDAILAAVSYAAQTLRNEEVLPDA